MPELPFLGNLARRCFRGGRGPAVGEIARAYNLVSAEQVEQARREGYAAGRAVGAALMSAVLDDSAPAARHHGARAQREAARWQ